MNTLKEDYELAKQHIFADWSRKKQIPDTLLNRIAYQRAKRQITEASFKLHMGLSGSVWWRIKRGEKKPDHEWLVRVANFFGVDVTELTAPYVPLHQRVERAAKPARPVRPYDQFGRTVWT